MDYSIPVIVITVVTFILLIVTSGVDIATYAYLNEHASKDHDLYRARTVALGMFLTTFFGVFVIGLIIGGVIVLHYKGESKSMVSKEDPSATTTINSHSGLVYGLSIFTLLALGIISLISGIGAFYVLAKVRDSAPYKANPESNDFQKVLAATVVAGILGLVMLFATIATIAVVLFLWSKSSKYIPADEGKGSAEPPPVPVGVEEFI